MSQCAICNTATNQPVCAKCARAYLTDLNELRTLLARLESVARREEHVGGRSQGHVSPAFAPTPVDLSAMDLLTEASETLEDVAGNCGIWDSVKWRRNLTRLVTRRTQLMNDPSVASDRERVWRLVQKVKLRLTPPSERIIIGPCLNPACGTELSIVGKCSDVVCPACGSVWSVDAVRQRRRERLRDETFTGTPAEAARWIYRKTHLYVTRKVIAMWLLRGSLPDTEHLGGGRHVFHLADLVAHAEEMRPRLGAG